MRRQESLSKLVDVLIRRHDSLRRTLQGELSQLSKSEERVVGDQGDHAFEAGHAQLHSQLAEVESRELAQIKRALEKHRRGKYGVCEVCQKHIPLARLRALPYATNCVRCKQATERSRGQNRVIELQVEADNNAGFQSGIAPELPF